jgi:hypothetical protein
MFEDSLLESGNRLKDKRGRYTGVAFLLEAVLLGIALLIPTPKNCPQPNS